MNLLEEFQKAEPLRIVKEGIGVMSIDSLERQWTVIKHLENTDMLFAEEKGGLSLMLGSMRRRDDGKLCINVDAKFSYDDMGNLRDVTSFNLDEEMRSNAIAILNQAIVERDAR